MNKKIKFKLCFYVTLALNVTTQVYASESETEAVVECKVDCPGVWTSSIELGYVAISGNKETRSLNSRLAVNYEVEKWRYDGFITAQTSSSEEQQTPYSKSESEKYTAQVKTDYQYSESAYSFGIAEYDETRDSGFDYQASFAAGIGYRFINEDTQKLKGEIGFGERKSKAEETMLTNSESIIRYAMLYKWKISKTSNFEQTLSSERGNDNKISKSYSALSANINAHLALKVSYTAKHQSDVPDGNKKLETITSFTVVYNF